MLPAGFREFVCGVVGWTPGEVYVQVWDVDLALLIVFFFSNFEGKIVPKS